MNQNRRACPTHERGNRKWLPYVGYVLRVMDYRRGWYCRRKPQRNCGETIWTDRSSSPKTWTVHCRGTERHDSHNGPDEFEKPSSGYFFSHLKTMKLCLIHQEIRQLWTWEIYLWVWLHSEPYSWRSSASCHLSFWREAPTRKMGCDYAEWGRSLAW